jgi:superfamily II DNA/RNA helicase/phosphatidylserine/phosphatidylglycerophosphate/cardiolipin synthase-like enzyme
MTERPQFVDNRDGNTLTAAITEYLDGLGGELVDSPDLDVVTGYFNPRGYFSIREGLDQVGDVRLLIGAQPDDEDREEWRKPGDPTDDEQYNQERVDEVLQSLDEDLARDRDLLGFSENVEEGLQNLVDWLRSDAVEVRRHEQGFVHGKAYLFEEGSHGVIAGSSNFTGAGLNSNLELNLGSYQPYVTQEVNQWFEDLWEESESYDLASLYEERFKAFDPYFIYLRVLYERYADELDEEREEEGGIQLANFQEDGRRRARRFLEERGGVIVADEVGLGKTYIGGKLLEETVQENRQRALVVAPAYLRDGMWKSVRSKWNFHYEVISYSQLRNEQQLGGDTAYLQQPVDDYQMVVLDEAHAFRNPNTQQSQALRQLLRGTPPKDVVMLTATPVNNSLWDLYYLLRYFIRNDAAFADEGIRSLRDRFKAAQSEDPSELNPESLFDVLDQTTVRRTRRFIKEHYDQARLPDGEGGYIYVDFPVQHPQRVDYDFDDTFGDDFFQDIAEGLAARDDIDESELKLARYRPSYYLDGEEDASELSLVGLLRTGLLKRFESSSKAFANTLDRMVRQNETALNLLNEGYIPDAEAIDEWVEMDSDEAFEEAFEGIDEAQVNAKPLTDGVGDPKTFRDDLKNDLEILQRWRDRAKSVSRDDDEKLRALRDTLHDVVEDAREDAQANTTDEEMFEGVFRRNRKVLLFSYYKDTVQWVLDYLKEAVENDEQLSCYEGRIAAVTGDGSVDGVSREDAVHGFAPNSTDAPEGSTDDYDILIATDVLGQGVNLQDARNVINYDLPWNPMRVVQRNGRIDRVNSPHDDIFPHCFFPEDRLDDLLGLEHRVRQKLTQAARTIGEEGGIFPDMNTVDRNYSDKKSDIEAIRNEEKDAYEQGGREAAAYSGEEYRQKLREGLNLYEDEVTSLPWAAGSGMRSPYPGYFFCARIGEELYLRFVSAEASREDELDGEEDNGLIRDTLGCLKRIECEEETERHLPPEAKDGVYEAWEKARNDIFAQWQHQTDPRNVQPDVPKILREVREHLADYPPTNTNQDGAERAREAVGAPLSRREQREFREIYEDEGLSPVEKSDQFVDKVEELGLEPFENPDPKPRVREEDIQLICWMVVSPEDRSRNWGGLEEQSTIGQ